jgi:GT2 family glycosyltransferase
MIEIVSATRHNEQSFWNHSPLGISLRRLSFDVRLEHYITFENQIGIGIIYNRRINSISSHDVLVFIHDDVWIDDFFLADHILQGLEQYDIIGIAGNCRRLPNQPAWAFIDDKFTWDNKMNLSGAVAHGSAPFGMVSYFGSVPSTCELLDGVLLAARKSILNAVDVTFDSIFKFHFYDMDFCRTARQKGLRLGTWHIAITHQSGGRFGSVEWKNMYANYLRKWKA